MTLRPVTGAKSQVIHLDMLVTGHASLGLAGSHERRHPHGSNGTPAVSNLVDSGNFAHSRRPVGLVSVLVRRPEDGQEQLAGTA